MYPRTTVADYLCPDCGAATLVIAASLELPPDSRSDEITVQAIACGKCGFAGAAAYEESRRGSLDSECWTHDGFRMPAGRASALRELLFTCPSPRNSECTCRAHRDLGRTVDGWWAGLDAWSTTGRFALRQAPLR